MSIENIFFCICFAVLFLIINLLQIDCYKTIRTPITFFSLIWCIVGFFSNIGVMDYITPSLLVNISMALGVIIFSLVFYCFTPKITKNINGSQSFGCDEIIDFRAVILVNIICMALTIPRTINSLKIISLYGYGFLRANLTNKELGISYGGLNDIVFAYMVEPALIATAFLSFFLLFSDKITKRIKYSLFFYSFISILMYAITSAGRGIIVKYSFGFLFVLLISKHKVLTTLYKMKAVRYALIAGVWFILMITFERGTWGDEGGKAESIFKTFYVYYFSGPAYMTKLMEVQNTYGGFGQLFFGSASFGFLTSFWSWLMIALTGRNQGALYLLGSVISNTYYNVAPDVKINAMYTCYYTFWVDWGYCGLVIGPSLLALYSSYLFKKIYTDGSYRYAVMYVFWLYILIRTVFKLDTISVGITIVYLCLRIFVRGKSISDRH